MKTKQIHRISFISLLLVLLLACCACGGGGQDAQKDNASSGSHKERGPVLIAKAEGKKIIKNDAAEIDVSNISQGYVCVKYLGNNKKVKMQMTKDGETYTYNLLKRGSYEIFPFFDGSGDYTIAIFENAGGSQYMQACSEKVNVKLEDENLPFLYPNEYVKYTADDPIVALSDEVTAKSGDDLKKVEDVFNYVTKTIDYDYDLAESVATDYLPDIDQVLEKKKGICFDYASVMSSMLRIQSIPTKLVIGYAGDVYHAWISVYTEDEGWVDNIIQFDGKNWTMMDPTTAASSGEMDDITNDSRYNALYFY
ncbi:transglutaminase-like domain-containing protein [Anaerovorax odorimutans]|uniref:Transglutaminase-like domain-containing protein n=1 Tax=Anaerovorax odorimutans TaxID=109327 RepID=A0ABT1RQN3_9FIRM|nr:transglutaminase-like domain-containing protein [Anaerovorax odorimutans]MCQ4637507.1 transglutaminase-like domain-containing protein [Anaerovorax odorimutans]